MELPKYISSLPADSLKSQTSNTRFYFSIGYLIIGFIMAIFANRNGFMSNYSMIYFFGFGLAGIISYHLYTKNPQMGITFNAGSIRIQSTLFSKKNIPVSEIDSITIHLSAIFINLKNNQTEKIELSNYTFGAVKELKELFKEYSAQNKIECFTK